MKTLCFASNNEGKINEIKSLLSDQYLIKSLIDIGCIEEIEETGKTLSENAKIKALHVYKNYGIDCFADDSGLLVDALNGAPGVYSARYAGEPSNNKKNIDLLLKNISGQMDRNASFQTVICLIIGGEFYYFNGKIDGQITLEKSGDKGFGYDPIFIPNGYDKTFADFTQEEKNAISHRGIAIKSMIDYLKN